MFEQENKTLIIGMGEVGASLYEVLHSIYRVHRLDTEPVDELDQQYDIIHICFPYFNGFIDAVKKYEQQFKPTVIVNHSTVPVGTTKQCGENVIHSPIRGVHPHLAEGIKTFVKELGTQNGKFGIAIERYFKKAGIPAEYVGQSSDATELAKIMSTTYYAWNIVFAKEMAKLCEKYGVDYDFVYKKWNHDYNAGYDSLSEDDVSIFHRPVLKNIPGKIGGHCLIPNCDFDDNIITEFIKKRNSEY